MLKTLLIQFRYDLSIGVVTFDTLPTREHERVFELISGIIGNSIDWPSTDTIVSEVSTVKWGRKIRNKKH